MESQKIINHLDHKDEDVQDLKQESSISLMITIMKIMVKVMMCNLLLRLTQKL